MNIINGSVSCIAVFFGCRPFICIFVLSLVLLQTGVSLALSVLSCTAYYLAKAPKHLSLRFALSVALLFAASLTVCRTLLLERKHQVSLHLANASKRHRPCLTHNCRPVWSVLSACLALSDVLTAPSKITSSLCSHQVTNSIILSSTAIAAGSSDG